MHSWKNESQTSENSPGCLCNHTLGYLSLGTYPWVPILGYLSLSLYLMHISYCDLLRETVPLGEHFSDP